MKNVMSFDVGGTFIKYAVMSMDGEIILKDKFPSPASNCRIKIPEVISNKVLEYKEKYDLYRVGISTAGQVDSDKGEIVFASDNLPDYTGTRLSDTIERITGLKTFIENDVNSAALGEMWKGAAKGIKTFVCVTIGTGIGGAIIIDGKLYKGVMGGAGEIGHIIINENGRPCTCGAAGCYERYASTSALIRSYIDEAQKNGVNTENIDGESLMTKVHNNDSLAVHVYDEFLDHLVTGMVNITHILDPGLIIIGGGISGQGKPFFDEIEKRFKNKAMASYASHTKIAQASLSNDAGIYGACYIAVNRQ